jgi:DUF1365 family protein
VTCEKRFFVVPYLRDSLAYCVTAEEVARATGINVSRVRNSLKAATSRGSVVSTTRNAVRYYTHRDTFGKELLDEYERREHWRNILRQGQPKL